MTASSVAETRLLSTAGAAAGTTGVATGVVSAAFLIFYGTIRFFIEFYRQPDAHIGYVALEWLSMGQLLCLPMIFAGFVLLTYFLRKA